MTCHCIQEPIIGQNDYEITGGDLVLYASLYHATAHIKPPCITIN